jgi:hypothetical protein
MCIQLSLSIEDVENFTVSDEMDQLVVRLKWAGLATTQLEWSLSSTSALPKPKNRNKILCLRCEKRVQVIEQVASVVAKYGKVDNLINYEV